MSNSCYELIHLDHMYICIYHRKDFFFVFQIFKNSFNIIILYIFFFLYIFINFRYIHGHKIINFLFSRRVLRLLFDEFSFFSILLYYSYLLSYKSLHCQRIDKIQKYIKYFHRSYVHEWRFAFTVEPEARSNERLNIFMPARTSKAFPIKSLNHLFCMQLRFWTSAFQRFTTVLIMRYMNFSWSTSPSTFTSINFLVLNCITL